MTWPDILVLIAFAVMFGGWRLAVWCFTPPPHRPPCDCTSCVDTAVAMVERDTLQDVARGDVHQ